MKNNTLKMFDIPLILDEIVPLLKINDLRNLCLVSRQFWTSFIPYLWSKLHFTSLTLLGKHDLGASHSPFLLCHRENQHIRHQYYRQSVRSVKLSARLPHWATTTSDLPLPVPHFPNLRQFKFRNQNILKSTYDKEEPTVNVPATLEFLKSHVSLCVVELLYVETGLGFTKQLKEAFKSLVNLTSLVLHPEGSLTLQDHFVLMEVGQRLEKFHLTTSNPFHCNRLPDSQEIELYKQSMETILPDECKIKDLFLNTEYFRFVMLDFLNRCPLIERLTIRMPPITGATIFRDMATIVREKCARLKHLELTSFGMGHSNQVDLILACNPTINQDSRPGLHSIRARLYVIGVHGSIDAILGHSATLTSICIIQGKGILGYEFHRIATCCTHLRSLITKITFMDSFPIALEEVVGKPWGCRDMRTLSILLSDHCTQPGRDSASEFLRNFYIQTGTLANLEVLSFQLSRAGWVPTRQLFLEGLVELYNLKKLRRFKFHKEEASVLTKQIITTMLEQWPKLEHLAGLLDDFRTPELADWLTELRPDIELSGFNDSELSIQSFSNSRG
ncbi:hypothetical protein BGZ76_006788 [Entomortierella beljakovae]|nr:hypothetical protein BGZ76_006788 [Entomortierella beljakovae]